MSITLFLCRISHSSTSPGVWPGLWPTMLAACMFLMLLGHAADSQAYTSGQGTSARGGEVASVLPRGEEALQGTLRLGDDIAVPIQIIAFRGEHIDARIWKRPGIWVAVALHAADLEGFEWTETRCAGASICKVISYRISNARMDMSRNTMLGHEDNSDVWLYQVDYAVIANPSGSSPGSERRNVCDPVFGEGREGIFVAGHHDDNGDGTWNPGGYTFSCGGGVIAKCARAWGYKPWKTLVTGAGQSIELQPLHRACVRAAQADYCGNGQSSTRDGTVIDMIDVYGFNRRITGTGMHREASFSPDGAVWIARTRWPLDELDSWPDPWPGSSAGAWIELPTCRVPRYVPGSSDPRALIDVWSHREPHQSSR